MITFILYWLPCFVTLIGLFVALGMDVEKMGLRRTIHETLAQIFGFTVAAFIPGINMVTAYFMLEEITRNKS